MTPDKLLELLKTDVVEVVFKKKNGEERVMLATLASQYLPEYTPTGEPKPFNGVLTVWDIEIQEWRSFRYDAILEVEYDEGDHLRREIF